MEEGNSLLQKMRRVIVRTIAVSQKKLVNVITAEMQNAHVIRNNFYL